MTLHVITLIYSAVCDYCHKIIIAGEEAFYNPHSRKCYHIDVCADRAEAG